MVLKLAEGFSSNIIKNEYILINDLQWVDDIEGILPQEVREKIERFIGDDGLARLVLSEIDNARDRQDNYEPIIPGQKISDISFIKDTIKFSKSIVDSLTSIPKRYVLTAMLPTGFSTYINEACDEVVNLPAGIKLRTGKNLNEKVSVNSPHERVNYGLFRDWLSDKDYDRSIKLDHIYFSLPIIGYAVPSSSSVMGREMEDHMRAFYGTSLALDLMSTKWQANSHKNPYIMIYNHEESEILVTEDLEEDLLDRHHLLSSYSFSQRSTSNRKKKLEQYLNKIGTIFNNNIDCRKLFSACVWYYRSKVNMRPVDSLLQATIAIEVMLGDRKAAEGIGLTNLLASRCAYLLGTSTRSRNEIAAKFKRVYDLRSQVVHEGKHLLKLADRETVGIAQSLCSSIIRSELDICAAELT